MWTFDLDKPEMVPPTVEQRVAMENTKLANFVARHQNRLQTLQHERDEAAQRLAQCNDSILRIEELIVTKTAQTEEKIKSY